jgi:hypothetical protein
VSNSDDSESDDDSLEILTPDAQSIPYSQPMSTEFAASGMYLHATFMFFKNCMSLSIVKITHAYPTHPCIRV